MYIDIIIPFMSEDTRAFNSHRLYRPIIIRSYAFYFILFVKNSKKVNSIIKVNKCREIDRLVPRIDLFSKLLYMRQT